MNREKRRALTSVIEELRSRIARIKQRWVNIVECERLVLPCDVELAWYFPCSPDKTLGASEADADARARREGLWADPAPVPPWEWRKGARRP